jgi:UDP-N-acetylmuramate dehydrogenase
MIPTAAREALEETLGDGVRFDVPMSRHTSLRVGGPADALVTPADRGALASLLGICAAYRIPYALLGGGFNTLALDTGVEGVVIQLGRLRRLEERPGCLLRAEAGVSHAQLSNFCCARGLSGLEFGAGIPGSVGGWLATNAGVPGREMKDVVCEVEVMSPTGRTVRHLGRDRLDFRYRRLAGLAPGSVLVSALLEVSPAEPSRVRAKVNRLLANRAETQPLDVPTCGSVFVNPPGEFAGRLIESAGLKGRRVGAAQISPRHANFISTAPGATAADVLALMQEAQAAVWKASRRRLVPEVRVLGRRS